MDYLLGQICLFPYNFAPYGFLECDGRTLQINSNSALYSLIGIQFGGDGHTTFAIPNIPPIKQGDIKLKYCIVTSGIYPQRD